MRGKDVWLIRSDGQDFIIVRIVEYRGHNERCTRMYGVTWGREPMQLWPETRLRLSSKTSSDTNNYYKQDEIWQTWYHDLQPDM